MPASLEHAIVSHGHIRELLVFYHSKVLSDDEFSKMFKEAVALVKKYMP